MRPLRGTRRRGTDGGDAEGSRRGPDGDCATPVSFPRRVLAPRSSRTIAAQANGSGRWGGPPKQRPRGGERGYLIN